MRAFAIALLAAALLAFTPLKVAFCARAGERTGAALGVFPFAGNVALRLSRVRAGKGREKARRAPEAKPKRRPDAALLWAVGRRLLHYIRFEELRAQGELGLADAAATALAAGGMRSFLYAVGAATGARVVFRVRPDFHARRVDGELAGIVSLRVGHIILAALAGIWESNRRHAHGKASH